jgi:hypothetical protein
LLISSLVIMFISLVLSNNSVYAQVNCVALKRFARDYLSLSKVIVTLSKIGFERFSVVTSMQNSKQKPKPGVRSPRSIGKVLKSYSSKLLSISSAI